VEADVSRTFFVLALCAGVAAALAGCNDSSSEKNSVKQTVIGFRDALALGSGEGACDEMTSRARKEIVRDASKDDPSYAGRACGAVLDDVLGAAPGGIKDTVRVFGHMEAKSVSVKGNRATATTNFGMVLILRKVGYRWLIDVPPSPVVAPAARHCQKSRGAQNQNSRCA
jgi:hypothetical protein